MKILITGATGFIGRHLVEYWKNSGHEIAVTSKSMDPNLFPAGISCLSADITIAEDIYAAITMVRPDLVIHFAASSKPNECEVEKDACYAVNVRGTQYVVDACTAIKAKLILLSTDFVFGDEGPYSETDDYCPVNYYGQTKVMAEAVVIKSQIDYAIVRTVMVLGKKLPGQHNTFLHWAKEQLEQQKPVKIFTDQYRSVTFVYDLCRGIESIVSNNSSGIYHLCGGEIFTPFQLAGELVNYFGLDKNLIQPVTRQTFAEIARRPENSVLNIDKARKELGFCPTLLKDYLVEIFPGTKEGNNG